MKKIYFLTLYLIAIVVIFSKCKNETEPLSSENTLTAITVNDENKNIIGNISGNNLVFNDSAVAGTTQVTVKAISFSAKASADVKKNDVIPLNKTLTITAENGSIKYYIVDINVETPTLTGDEMTITDERTTITGNEMSITGNEMTLTGSPVIPLVIEPITRAQLAIATITDSGATLSGSFVKVNNPLITEMGILVTTNIRIKLELNNTNEAPNGTLKLAATNEQLTLANSPALTIIPFSFPITNLASFTTYYFRGYAAISGEGILYTDKIHGKTLASKVRILNFNVHLPYNVTAMNSDGSFRMNYYKDPSPMRSFGVLITSGNGILALNGENAPAGARLITGNATAIATANTSTNGIVSLSAANLALGTIYTFRGYVQNDAGITYTPIFAQTTPGVFTPIPDDNFRNAILSCINTNGTTTLRGQTDATNFGCTKSFNGMITANGNGIRTAVLRTITQFNYGDHPAKPIPIKIRSLSGVEQMTNLTRLDVQNNLLSSFNLPVNTALTYLNVARNYSLSSLDVSQNTALTYLNIKLTRRLSSVDVSQNTALTHLDVNGTKLRNIDISQNTALTHLDVSNNSLSSLDISANTTLTHLYVSNNKLWRLDLSQNTALTHLYVRYNPFLRGLDISTNTALTLLDVRNNSCFCIETDASQLVSATLEFHSYCQTLSVTCP